MKHKTTSSTQRRWWVLILGGWGLFFTIHCLVTILRVHLMYHYQDPAFFVLEIPFFFVAFVWVSLGTIRLCGRILAAIASQILAIVLIIVQLAAALPCWLFLAFQVHLWAGGNL